MANRYAIQQVGVLDGTVPAKMADGRQVNAKNRSIIASKQVLADAIADTITLGVLPAGAMITAILFSTDTSLGTATIAIGIAGTVAKYTAAAVFTTPLNIPTCIGPKASIIAAGPEATEQLLIATVAVAALPVGAVMNWEIEYIISA